MQYDSGVRYDGVVCRMSGVKYDNGVQCHCAVNYDCAVCSMSDVKYDSVVQCHYDCVVCGVTAWCGVQYDCYGQ